MSNAKRPVHEIRMGRIKAAIWENETREGIRHNVALSRIFKDGNSWKDSTSFGRDDLPLVIKIADLAHTWIFDHAAGPMDSAIAAANASAGEEVHF